MGPDPKGSAPDAAAGSESEPAPHAGTFFVVATPIGNLDDASPRLRQTLERAALVLCEDTRRSGLLIQRLGVSPRRLLSANEHDEASRIPVVLERLRAGDDVALVSDAGTPTVSDPGHALVRAVVEAGLPVSPIPGPSAVIAALSVCGLPTDRFAFEGFPPRKRQARREAFERLAQEPRTVVLYESPHRLGETLRELGATFGSERRAFLGRELTKLHEELAHGTLDELITRFADAPVRGEVVLAVAGAATAEPAPEELDDDDVRREIEDAVAQGASERDAMKALARRLGVSRREVYRIVKIDPGDAGRE